MRLIDHTQKTDLCLLGTSIDSERLYSVFVKLSGTRCDMLFSRVSHFPTVFDEFSKLGVFSYFLEACYTVWLQNCNWPSS